MVGLFSIERCLEFGGWDVTEVAVEALRVVPVHPAEGGCQWPLRTAHGRPAEMPAGGHENCSVIATRSAHQGVGDRGRTVKRSVKFRKNQPDPS